MGRAFARDLAMLLLLLAAVTPGRAQDLRGRLRVGAQEIEGEESTLDVLDENYQVQFRMPVSQRFTYMIRATHIDSSTEQRFDGTSVEGGRKLTEPTVEVAWKAPLWDLATGLRYTVERNELEGGDERETRSDWFSRFSWRPVKGPELSVLYDRLRFRDRDPRVLSEDETRLFATLAQQVGPVRWSWDVERRDFQDNTIDFERDQRQNTINLDYRDSFPDKRVTVTAGLLLREDRKVETAGVPVDVERGVPAREGLFAIDDTPLMDPLAPEPRLIDGDTLSPAGIAIGGTADGGGTDRNIGLDFDFARTVDRIDLWIDVPIPSVSVNRFIWDLYTSANNLDWVLAEAQVGFAFNSTFNRFELSFAPVAARYVKLVNTDHDPNLGPVFVTEMAAFVTEELIGEDRRTDSTGNASLTVSYSPTERWDFGSSSFLGFDRTENGTGRTGEDRLDQSLSALYRATSKVSSNALMRWRVRDRDLGAGEDDFSWTVGVSSTPLDTLDLALSYNQRKEREDKQDDLEINTWQFRTSAQLLTELNLSLDLGYTTTQDFELDQSNRQRSARLLLFTRPRSDLTISSDLLLDRTTFVGPLVVGSREQDQTIWSNRVTYRPSALISFVGILRYEDFQTGSGVAKTLNVDWLPFPGGALQFTVSYLTDAQAVSGGERDQLRGLVRWTVRQGMILEGSYFRDERREDGDSTVTEALGVLLEIRF